MIDEVGPIRSGRVLVGKFQEHNGCITQPHRRGATGCNLVCNIIRMLLYVTDNNRFWFLSEGMVWLMEEVLSDLVEL